VTLESCKNSYPKPSPVDRLCLDYLTVVGITSLYFVTLLSRKISSALVKDRNITCVVFTTGPEDYIYFKN